MLTYFLFSCKSITSVSSYFNVRSVKAIYEMFLNSFVKYKRTNKVDLFNTGRHMDVKTNQPMSTQNAPKQILEKKKTDIIAKELN